MKEISYNTGVHAVNVELYDPDANGVLTVCLDQ